MDGGPGAPWLRGASLLIILTKNQPDTKQEQREQSPQGAGLGHDSALTQQISREVDGQDDADREDANHHQQADDVALEGQVVHRVFATLLPDLLVPAGGPQIRCQRMADSGVVVSNWFILTLF